MGIEEWDYVVVGAGSAGCALTEELVLTGAKVLLLEAGGRESTHRRRGCARLGFGVRGDHLRAMISPRSRATPPATATACQGLSRT